jgi:glucose/arabinose dehydrogenase
VLLRDTNGDGKADQKFVMDNPALDLPFGMVFRDGRLIIANHNAVLSYPYALGQTSLPASPRS